MKHAWIHLLALLFAVAACGAPARGAEATDPLTKLEQRLPQRPADCTDQTTIDVRVLATAAEAAAARQAIAAEDVSNDRRLDNARRVIAVQQRVDRAGEILLLVRTAFPNEPDDANRAARIRNFLRCSSVMTDLSGRIRYLSFDVLRSIAMDLADEPATLSQLLDLLTAARSGVGAAALAPLLFDTTKTGEPSPSVGPQIRRQILELIRASRQYALDAELARFIRQPGQSPELVIAAAETLREVGLPQAQRPGSDATLPAPEITAGPMYEIVQAIDPAKLDAATVTRRDELLKWLDVARRQGCTEETYRLGRVDIRAGDWLLMRNPSPYNLFTDLSPGLYTHVGVVATETGSDGIRRFLVVDLPERGNTLSSTTIDTFVKRTLNYTVLRANDPAAARMATAAADIIDNPSQFDLRFRTDEVEALKGQKLKGAKIQGYCAGLLLLCGQETGEPRNHFFPLPEHPAGGNTLANLAKVGISMGHDFLSPTGPLFSPHMKMIGGRDPLYDPRRQIEQAAYDHFAWGLAHWELGPSPDWYQSLRQNLAESAKGNPLLAKALANAAGVNENIDLVAAAKLGAVVESLDGIATGASNEFAEAREAIMADDQPPVRPLLRGALRAKQMQQLQQNSPTAVYRARHPDLYRAWAAESVTPRQLRERLVEYYIVAAQQQVDERFFRHSAAKAAQ
ncbi:MAG: hypothetical protein K8T25_13530 [Planctomycetia bacterium]|nr:hypothetical protein [Planctomycetia bacterium]